MRLVINDSVSYQYYIKGKDDIKPPYGKKFRGHSTYIDISRNLIIHQSQPFQESRYRIKDTIPKVVWEFFEVQKTILNYVCKKATCIYNDGVYIAWYTKEIPLAFGPNVLTGLPGVMLGLENTKWGHVYTATKISKEGIQIIEPKVGKIINPQQFEKIKERLPKRKIEITEIITFPR